MLFVVMVPGAAETFFSCGNLLFGSPGAKASGAKPAKTFCSLQNAAMRNLGMRVRAMFHHHFFEEYCVLHRLSCSAWRWWLLQEGWKGSPVGTHLRKPCARLRFLHFGIGPSSGLSVGPGPKPGPRLIPYKIVLPGKGYASKFPTK